MTKAFQQIINVFVRYQDRARLDELKVHRETLLFDIKARPSEPYDQSSLIRQIEEEIQMINTGLEMLTCS